MINQRQSSERVPSVAKKTLHNRATFDTNDSILNTTDDAIAIVVRTPTRKFAWDLTTSLRGVRCEKPRCFDASGFVLTYLILRKFLEYRILVLVRLSLKVNLVSFAFVSSSKRRTSCKRPCWSLIILFWSCFLFTRCKLTFLFWYFS